MKRYKTKFAIIFWHVIIGSLLLVSICHLFNYYTTQTLSFEYVSRIPKFDNCYPMGINYIRNKDMMRYWLVDFYKKPSCIRAGLVGCDSIVVSNLITTLNFDEYDYVVSYLRRISKLKYSPYLKKTSEDCLHYSQMPLIPEYERDTIDSIYIYRVKKNNIFRSLIP